MYIYGFLLGMTDIMTSQNIDLSSCDTLYKNIHDFWLLFAGFLFGYSSTVKMEAIFLRKAYGLSHNYSALQPETSPYNHHCENIKFNMHGIFPIDH
jgi:hypothetical protein